MCVLFVFLIYFGLMIANQCIGTRVAPSGAFCYFAPGKGVKYCDQCVCLSVCLSAPISQNRMSRLHKFSVHVNCGRG